MRIVSISWLHENLENLEKIDAMINIVANFEDKIQSGWLFHSRILNTLLASKSDSFVLVIILGSHGYRI